MSTAADYRGFIRAFLGTDFGNTVSGILFDDDYRGRAVVTRVVNGFSAECRLSLIRTEGKRAATKSGGIFSLAAKWALIGPNRSFASLKSEHILRHSKYNGS